MVTYTSLVANVPRMIYAENRSLVEDMPLVITQAEDELLLRIDHDLFRTTITGKTIGVANELDLTAEDPRVLEVRSIRIAYRNGQVPLERRDIERLTMLYPDGRKRMPRYYAEDGDPLKYRFFPAPDKDYPVSIAANVEFARLTDQVDTNILTDQFPRAVENAVLFRASIYMKDSEGEQRYMTQMQGAIDEANAQIARRRRDETGQRPRETANAVGS